MKILDLGGFDAAEGGAIDVDHGCARRISLDAEFAGDRVDVFGRGAGAG